MTVKERLILFIKSQGLGQGAFERKVGLSNGYVNNIRKSIQPDKVQKIALIFPDLNTGWLMTGEGEMLKSDLKPEHCINTEKYLEVMEKYAALQEKYATLQEAYTSLLWEFQKKDATHLAGAAKTGGR